MIFFSKDAEESFDKLLYYPYTIGKHLHKTNSDVNNIMSALSSLPIVAPGVMARRVIPNIGTITYLSTPTSYFIQYISWSIALTRFYYVKSNFITFNSQGNITSVHPALYTDRNEPSFECDNGFKVVSRFVAVRGKRTEVFNFKDLSGHIICDIDFTQVKPFDEYKDMTARGYTPNRRCYMVFEDGYKEEVNESRNARLESIINECVKECLSEYCNQPILLENFSARHYSNQISEITENFLSFKNTVDRLGGYYQTWQGYAIKISLKPFFDKKSNIQPKYRRNKEYYIRINYDYKKNDNVVTGFYNPNKLHKTDFQIELTVPSQAQYNDIFHSLEHEVTHLIDDLIKESKDLHVYSFPTIQMENSGLPKFARMILYVLWTNTEFNAWQANYQQMCGDKDFLDVMMKYLNEANESYNEKEWQNIQFFVSNKIKSDRVQQLKPFAFKNYFIKTSFKLLKKMVKKYY